VAKVSLKNVQVSRVFQDGKAAEVIEQYKTRDGDKKTKYTLWFTEPHGLTEGSIIDAEGLLSARLREFESQSDGLIRFVQISLNNASAKVTQTPQVGHAAVNQVWPAVASPGQLETDPGAPF
jgi:hypothetical protein